MNLTTGGLTGSFEYVGYSGSGGQGFATFEQTGGANTVTSLTIGSHSQYLLSGGTLTINSKLANNGIVNGGGGAGTWWTTDWSI